MQEAVTGFLSNVERFLRWIYPGLLVLGLLYLGRTDGPMVFLHLKNGSDAIQIFGLLVGVIVASILIYAAQRYLVHEMVIQYLLFLCGKGDAFNYAKHKGKPPPLRRRCDPTPFWCWSSRLNVESRTLGRDYNELRDYAWGVTHALGLTWWLILLGGLRAAPESQLGKLPDWVLGVVVAGMFVVWLWQELRNVWPPLWGNIEELKRLLRSDSVLPPVLHGS